MDGVVHLFVDRDSRQVTASLSLCALSLPVP